MSHTLKTLKRRHLDTVSSTVPLQVPLQLEVILICRNFQLRILLGQETALWIHFKFQYRIPHYRLEDRSILRIPFDEFSSRLNAAFPLNGLRIPKFHCCTSKFQH